MVACASIHRDHISADARIGGQDLIATLISLNAAVMKIITAIGMETIRITMVYITLHVQTHGVELSTILKWMNANVLPARITEHANKRELNMYANAQANVLETIVKTT
ncbi:hypothetical protein ACJMK2_037818 [Sinanodonta woodiana]|uniref:Uncharacterized protein n=1 Tax=Sinanodonta woodiana TaxID=1069815 RepID=A0ABD3WN10_SINWO